MKKCTAALKSASPISFSRPIVSVRSTGETHDAFEERTWRERMHVNGNGTVYIPANALKNCLSDCARYLSETVKGKGKATYTKHFEAGLMVLDNLELGIKADRVQGERVFVPSDGRKGGGSRVWKTFPIVPEWKTEATIYVVDPVLMDHTEKIEEYLGHAGKFIGLHRWRPRNGGLYGRFEVVSFAVNEA